ncbi:hypothetical protein ANO11243_045670 [Dothideomycetidae sp. 11243]|nr:hypothetical protein ANO11243_045670 [fungal sp. No.11243]
MALDMEPQVYHPPEPGMPSPADSANDVADHSWYRHSGQTGDFSSGRSTSPNSTEWRRSGLYSSKSPSLDPRRITPTLHASLVSEILSLRRELEHKNVSIDDLETSLQSNKAELDSVNECLGRMVRESSSQKKKSEEVENNLYRVTEELIRERDQAVSGGHDLRARLNTLTSQARRQEEDLERWQQEWEQKSRSWETERQTLERRVNLTEGHLRSLVESLQSQQHVTDSSDQSQFQGDHFAPATPRRNVPRTAHHRNESSASAFSDRFVTASPRHSMRNGFSTEKSLAEELDFEEDGFDSDELVGDDEKIVIDEAATAEPVSKARKVLGLELPATKEDLPLPPNIQPGPPEVLVSPVHEGPPGLLDRHLADAQNHVTWETPGRPLSLEYFPTQLAAELPTERSSGLIPVSVVGNYAPVTEHVSGPIDNTASLQLPRKHYSDAATQYDPPAESVIFEMDASAAEHQSHTLELPSIAVQPPSTAPNSPRQSIFTPQTVDVAVQTDHLVTRSLTDSGMQTEEIRIDRRRFMGHLLDGTTSGPANTRPVSLQSQLTTNTFQSVSVQEITTSLATQAIRETAQRTALATSPRFNESGISPNMQNRSSFWGGQSAGSSSMFASLQEEPGIQSGQSSLFGRELRESKALGDLSGDELRTFLDFHNQAPEKSDTLNGTMLEDSERVTSHKQTGSRPMGPAELRTSFRSRASSVESYESEMSGVNHRMAPFPVPDRSSSRIQGQELDEDSAFGTPNGSPTSRRHRGDAQRPSSLRKARSASSITRSHQTSPTRRRRAIPRHPVHSTLYEDSAYEPSSHQYNVDHNVSNLAGTQMNPTRALTPVHEDDDAQLIDAVATAMIGEWLWKYASKRSSFGSHEGNRKPYEDASRQKRWVWLSPHDRTIMWGSKQPSSGQALMGRSSRRLRIKTVLDVKDDNSAPRTTNNGMGCFGRSIIVLSPERALKLTATTKERHYLWLMALSFLANPAQGPPQIPRLPSSAALPGIRKGINAPDPDDPLIEQSVIKANANLLYQSRGHNSVTAEEDLYAYPSPNPSDMYTYDSATNGTAARSYDRPGTAASSNDIQSIPRYQTGTYASSTNAKSSGRRRSSVGPLDFTAPLSALKSLTNRKTPSLMSISSRNTRNGPKSPAMSSRSGYESSPSAADHAGASVSTMQMTAFIDDSQDDEGSSQHPVADGLGISTMPVPKSPQRQARGAGSGRGLVEAVRAHASSANHIQPQTGRGAIRSSSLSNRGSQASPSFGLPYNKSQLYDGENSSISPSVGTDDRRRMGYVFDDHGTDPFKGF